MAASVGGRVGVICLVGLMAVSACSEGGSGLSAPSVDAGESETDIDLPSTDPSEPVLPSVDEPSSDTVVLTTTTSTTQPSTTTTQPPTTTATIPPPVIPSDVLFDSGSSELKPEATPYLDDLASELSARHPTAFVRFVGHTDSRGSEEQNNKLSLMRAQAVMRWFLSRGFDEAKLSARGDGESELLEPDTDSRGEFIPEAGARNRRVVIEIEAE